MQASKKRERPYLDLQT